MSTETLTTLALGSRVYRVTGGKAPHRVTLDPMACDCADFRYRGVHRAPPSCKHIAAVVAFRDAEPLTDLLDGITDAETLHLVDPSHGLGYEPYKPATIDPDDRAIAVVVIERWIKLRRVKPKPHGYRTLWLAACAAKNGFECEQDNPSQAAEYFATAALAVRWMAQKGRVA